MSSAKRFGSFDGRSPRARLLHIRDEIEGVEYQRLDDLRIWEIATVHLPALEPIIREMIAELDD